MSTTLFEATHSALTKRLQQSVNHSIATLEATPEDRLDYKPTDTARSVRELSQHSVLGNNYCLQAFSVPVQGDVTATSIADLAAELQKTGAALVEFISSRSEEELVSVVDFFGGEVSVVQMAMITEWHLSRHGAQIDYLQTTWNDLEDRY